VPGTPQRAPGARRWRAHAAFLLCLLRTAAPLTGARPAAAVESGPQGIVRQFCQADGLGHRVSLRGWPDFAPIVSWPFEPAWDVVVLINGYTVGSPRPDEGGALAVDVDYTVVGQVSALGFDTSVHVETVTFRVHAPEVGWRIIGPPPPPHIFGPRVDVDLMRRSFESGALNFLPNSLFVWQMFRSAGWNVPYQRTADLLSGDGYRAVEKPKVGDIVVYLHDDVAYHVGILEAESQVVSSTLNAGIVRTPIDAFAGDVRYARLIKPAPMPTRTRPPRPAQPSPPPRVTATGRAQPPGPPRTPSPPVPTPVAGHMLP